MEKQEGRRAGAPTALRGAIALFLLRPAFGRLVADAVDRAHLLVAHQQRAVGHLRHVRRPAPELVAVLALVEAGEARRRLGALAVGVRAYVQHVEAVALGAGPAALPRDEQ